MRQKPGRNQGGGKEERGSRANTRKLHNISYYLWEKRKAEEIEKNFTAVHNILQSKKCKKVGASKKGVEPGIKGQGKWEVCTPYLPQQSPT